MTAKPKGKRRSRPAPSEDAPIHAEDFVSCLPDHRYIYKPTGAAWPPESVDACLGAEERRRIDRENAVVQQTWCPGKPQIIEGQVVSEGGWIDHPGARVFNQYRPPAALAGDPAGAVYWRDHLRYIYPNDAEHIEKWLAQRVQQPGNKINHALVLGGSQGIGKDSLLEPVRWAVGPHNMQEISPPQMLGQFNPWVKCVLLRLNEARDHGDGDRYSFYDHSKIYFAAPPFVLPVNEKNIRSYSVFNVMGVVITTNHRTDGIYLPADDRRHFVAWSERSREDFGSAYWADLWAWYSNGGFGHVAAFLRELDLSGFDPKAPPPQTAAFHAIVAAGAAPEDGEMRDLIDRAQTPDAITLEMVVSLATEMNLQYLAGEMRDRRGRRSMPHKMERAGYVPVRNPDADDGLFKIGGRRQVVYSRRVLATSDQIRAARELIAGQSGRSDQ